MKMTIIVFWDVMLLSCNIGANVAEESAAIVFGINNITELNTEFVFRA
jgi:hypothetical protein